MCLSFLEVLKFLGRLREKEKKNIKEVYDISNLVDADNLTHCKLFSYISVAKFEQGQTSFLPRANHSSFRHEEKNTSVLISSTHQFLKPTLSLYRTTLISLLLLGSEATYF